MSDNVRAPKAPKAIVEQFEVHAEENAAATVAAGEGDAPSARDEGPARDAVCDDAAPAPGAHASHRGFQRATIGFFEGVGRTAWAYADAHPHATLYGIIGFVLSVLILVIGLWDTIVIAVFVFVGTVIGQMVDGDNATVNFIRRLLDGRK